MPGCFPTLEVCDGLDNNCNGNIDEGLLNACGTCGPVPLEVCDGKDNNCDGEADEGLLNACGTCGRIPPEVCDGSDNDCDGDVDDGFDLSSPCDSSGKCPQSRACSADHLSSVCRDDPNQFGEEICDEIDNDCDGLVDLIAENGSVTSVCACEPHTLSIGKSVDASVAGNANLCAATKCEGDFVPRLMVDGTCYPVCKTSGITGGDSWGYENGGSCLVAGTPRAITASVCPADGLPKGMAITYCLDCSGTIDLPFAMCESVPRFDLTAFGQGKAWLRVDYTYSGSGPAQAPVNLWINADGGRRKFLPLVRIGDSPSRYEKVLRVNEACFSATASALFGSTCPGQGQHCAHCGDTDLCGAVGQCGQYDLSKASLQVAAEFCGAGSGIQAGTVTLHLVELIPPNCLSP